MPRRVTTMHDELDQRASAYSAHPRARVDFAAGNQLSCLVTGGGLGVGPGGEPEVIWRPVRRYRRSAAWTAEPSWRVARGHGVVQRQACGVVLCACTDGLTQLDAAR